MLRRVPRNLRRTVLAVVLLAVTVSVWQSWTSGTPAGGWVQTPFGPLGPADRDLLVKVRLAGLWQQPAGQQAMAQGGEAAVKEAGRAISAEQGDLDARVRDVATQLGVMLPAAPTSQQLAWMAELSAKRGADYDRAFAQRMREADGAMLPTIAQVRASTRNELVRALAADADTFVTRRIQYVEGTGLVDYTSLPEAPAPGLLSGGRGAGDLIVPLVVFAAALFGAAAIAMAVRRRQRRRPRAAARTIQAVRAATHRREPLPALVQIPAPRAAEPRARHALQR